MIEEFREAALDPTVAKVSLNGNLTISEPIIIGRRPNGKGQQFKLIELNGYSITMTEDLPIFKYEASSLSAANINLATTIIVRLGTLIGGSKGAEIIGSYGCEFVNVSFADQTDIQLDLQFCLAAKVTNCWFYNPLKNGLRISRGHFSGANSANSQSNMTVVNGCHFKGWQEQTDTQIEVLSSNNVRIVDCIIEGGNPTYGIKFHGSSTHTRLLMIENLWFECVPREAGIYTNIAGITDINGICTQHPFKLFQVDNNLSRLSVQNAQQIHSGCYAQVTDSCDISVRSSAVHLASRDFWKLADGTNSPTSFFSASDMYRNNLPDVTYGNDVEVEESNIHVFDFGTDITEVEFKPNDPYFILGKFTLETISADGTIFALGNAQRPDDGRYSLVRVRTVRHSGSGLGSLHFYLFGQGLYNSQLSGDYIETGIEAGKEYVCYLHFDGTTYTAGVRGGNSRQYPAIEMTQDLTALTGMKYIFPNRPNGNGFAYGQFEGKFYKGAATIQQMNAFIQSF